MAKFALECPHCGTVNKASTFFLAKKTITCGKCKEEINVREARTAIGNCKNCGNIAFDVAKGICPICKEKIALSDTASATSLDDLKQKGTPLFLCPECGCNIQASKQGGELLCPVCDHRFDGYEDIFQIIQKSKLVSAGTVSVIKYEGDNDIFVWKHPIENFNFGSQLIVHESQEAIFFLNGQALDLFGPGKYSLETEKLPTFSNVYTASTGSQNAFHSEVYFINKTVQMGMKWGTDQRVSFTDPATGILLDIGASGELGLRIKDSRKLLVELVGTKSGIAWDSDGRNFAKSLADTFRTPVQTTLRANLAAIIRRQQLDILTIDEKLIELSTALKTEVAKEFEKYGLEVCEFWVKNIALPEDDPRFKQLRQMRGATNFANLTAETEAGIEKAGRKAMYERQETELEKQQHELRMQMARAQAEAELKRIKAQSDAEVLTAKGSAVNELRLQKGLNEASIMQAKGYSHRDELETEVRLEQAKSIGKVGSNGGSGGSGTGSIASDVVNAGVNIAIASEIAAKTKDAIKDFTAPDTKTAKDGWVCAKCGTSNTGKFCSECASPKPSGNKWVCAKCGTENTGKFCSECASPKPSGNSWVCSKCGTENTGKFCSECASPRGDN